MPIRTGNTTISSSRYSSLKAIYIVIIKLGVTVKIYDEIIFKKQTNYGQQKKRKFKNKNNLFGRFSQNHYVTKLHFLFRSL